MIGTRKNRQQNIAKITWGPATAERSNQTIVMAALETFRMALMVSPPRPKIEPLNLLSNNTRNDRDWLALGSRLAVSSVEGMYMGNISGIAVTTTSDGTDDDFVVVVVV